MRQLILGTAGHIDHGKTALVKALTGVDTDRLPEERKRGITIDLGFADLTLDSETHVGIVDVPGHEGFVRNMLAGATGIDIGLLVVAADEGVMPQTREHLAILQLLGVRGLVVALTKSDLADTDWQALVADEVRELLATGPYANCPIQTVSARTGDGLADLVETLRVQATHVTARRADDLFRMPIDRVFTVRGTGTVVTGTVWSGTLNREHSLRLMPAGRKVRVRAIQTHGQDRASASAGERSAIALAGIDRADVTRGDVLVDSDAWVAGHIVTVRLGVLEDAPPIRRGQRVRFHLGTVEALGRVVPLDRTAIEAGDEAWAQLRLEQAVVARAGDRFVLRSYSPITTIGGGRIAEPAAPRRKRVTATLDRLLTELLGGDASASAAAAVRVASWAGVPAHALAVRAPLAPTESDDAVRDPASRIRRIGAGLIHHDLVESAMDRIRTSLREYHDGRPLAPGLSREQLRQVVPAVAPTLADFAIATLAESGELVVDGHTARLAHHEARLTPDQDRAANEILEVLERAGVSAPTRDEMPAHLSGRPDADDLIHYLERQGRVVALADDRYILADAALSAISQVQAGLGGRTGLGPGDFREMFGISRKYLIPLLGYLDRLGVTVRNGELRDVSRVETPHEAEGA